MAATGAQSRTVRLSPDTADKQHEHHGADVAAGDYALVQRILDEGEFFHSTPMHIIGYAEAHGRLWAAIFKTTADKQGLYLQSLHLGRARNLRAARKNAESVK